MNFSFDISKISKKLIQKFKNYKLKSINF